MVELEIEHLIGADEVQLHGRLKDHSSVRVVVRIPRLYEAASRREIADNWRFASYVGERIAEKCSQATCSFKQVDHLNPDLPPGTGEIMLDVVPNDVTGLCSTLLELADFFDPNNTEPRALVHDYIDDWAANRGETAPRLAELERTYRKEEELAQEEEVDDDE